MEDDGVIETVEKFWVEDLLNLFFDALGHDFVRSVFVAGVETNSAALDDVSGADVRSHDQDRILEIDHPAVVVGNATVVENLQQNVEDIGVSLLDLIEQDDAVRLVANSLGKRAAILVTHISRRRADEAADRELLHVL